MLNTAPSWENNADVEHKINKRAWTIRGGIH